MDQFQNAGLSQDPAGLKSHRTEGDPLRRDLGLEGRLMVCGKKILRITHGRFQFPVSFSPFPSRLKSRPTPAGPAPPAPRTDLICPRHNPPTPNKSSASCRDCVEPKTKSPETGRRTTR